MNHLIDGLKRAELGDNPLYRQELELLEDELKHIRNQLEKKEKQHERAVVAWENEVCGLMISLNTIHKAHAQSANKLDQQYDKLREGEAREAILRDACSELKESAKQLETAHSDVLVKRGVELQCTQIGEQRIVQLTNQLSETQSQNILLSSQLTQLWQEALRTQSETVAQHSELEELLSVKECNKTLSSQKDTLLAENSAAKNELAQWQARVNHLLEVYDKMDPEEFRELQTLKEEHMAKIANLSESVKQMGECQERQQELANKNQELEVEKTFLLEQLNVTEAALDEKSRKVERMQDELKKINIKARQQTESLEEKVSTLETENAQLKTANADKERQLQAVKNLHQSQVSQREAKLKSVSTCKVSSTQPSPSSTYIDPSRLVTAVRPTIPSTTTNPTTLPVVNPICRDQISVSISPFTSSLMTSSAQPTSSLPSTLQTVSSEWTMYIPGAGKQTPTNFNLSHVQQDLMGGLTSHSGSKRRREEAEVATSSTSESNSKRKRVKVHSERL